MRVVSTFAGLGGSSFGYEQAGFDVVGAVEFQQDIAATYRLNHDAPVLVADVRELSGKDLVTEFGEFDVLDGSPPCQAFSGLNPTAQSERAQVKSHADGSYQRSDDLLYEWARLVAEARPRYAVMENVAPLASKRYRAWLYPALAVLKTADYHLELNVHNAADYGCPSTRRRMILTARRGEPWSGYQWPRQRHVPAFAVLPDQAEALIIKRGTDRTYQWRTLNTPAPAINTRGIGYGAKTQHALVVDDQMQHDIETGQPLIPSRWQPEIRTAARHRPIRTLCVDEVRRLMGFPSLSWLTASSYGRRWTMIGNSVPPPLSRAIADRIAA